ncbi:hypothetical protein KAR48_18450, partial [bacterium]|nr:hypothetical protein [bacterium]
ILKLYVGQYQLEVDKNIKFDIQFTEGRLILTQLGTENRDELFPKSDTQFFMEKDSEDFFSFEKSDGDAHHTLWMHIQGMCLKGNVIYP